jgi:6-pyruvoyltetrahydropterin/6-carboxytetrahydropterin synthase
MKVGVIEFVECAHSATVNGKRAALHGHTYKIEVAVEGPLENDIVFDFCELRSIVKKVLEKYHQKNIDELLENSTGENFARTICEGIRSNLPKKLKLHIKLWQGHDKWVEHSE